MASKPYWRLLNQKCGDDPEPGLPPFHYTTPPPQSQTPSPGQKLPQGFAGGVSRHFNHFHAELAARPDSILLRKIREDSEARQRTEENRRFSENARFSKDL